MDVTEKLRRLGSHKAISSNCMLKNGNGLQQSSLIGHKNSELCDIPLEIDLPDKIIHDNVLITPSYIKFCDPSEGITLRECVTIKNMGKKPAFIRICEPKSLAFNLQTIKRGVMLSPGLALRRWISYSYKRSTLLHALIPIEINGYNIDYHVICTLKTELIQISPASIDFGIVDIGCSSGLKVLTISNIGGKTTRFTIDLGSNELHITVKPHKGIVRPHSSETLDLEMIGIDEGKFVGEFWIKSIPNIRVAIKASVIIPRLVFDYPNTTVDFTLVSFPGTFVGTRKCKTFNLKNISSKFSNFVVLAEIKKQLIPIQEIDLKQHPEFLMFEIIPFEGGLGSFKSTVFSILFKPLHNLPPLKNKEMLSQDFMIFLRLIRVHCTEVEDILSVKRLIGTKLNQALSITDEKNQLLPSTMSILNQTTEMIRICIHGEAEFVQLQFHPDELHLEISESCQIAKGVLNITNLSTKSFVTLSFVRFGIAHCKPLENIIGPEETVKVVIIIPGKMIIQPKTVLKLSFNVRADSAESELSNIKVRIGTYFVKCHVKFSGPKIPRSTFSAHKNINTEEFPNRLLKTEKCEPLTIESLGLINVKRSKNHLVKTISNSLMQLTPLQLYYIKVSPTIFNFGIIAPKVPNYQKLTIKNQNKFPVSVDLSSLCPINVRFPSGSSTTLKPNQAITKFVEIRCDLLGKFNTYIDYTINRNHTFELALTAKVVNKHLTINTNEIIFGKNFMSQECYCPLWTYVELKNSFNTRINFHWALPTSASYVLEPKSGVIRGKKNLLVQISYVPNLLQNHQTEAVVFCESGYQMTLNINTTLPSPKVAFLKDIINVCEIPLNLTHSVTSVLHNTDYYEALFEVVSTDLPPGYEIKPKSGIIPPRGIALIFITFKFSICVEFWINVNVVIQKSKKLSLKVMGRVLFPLFSFSLPNIDIGRVHTGGFYAYPFAIKNDNKTPLVLKFPLNDYPEFVVSSVNQPSRSAENKEIKEITLQPKTTQNLYLHFQPKNLAIYNIYLPIIINDLLGPVIYENLATEQTKYFFESNEVLYNFNEHIKVLEVPIKLPKMHIHGTVINQMVQFNKLIFSFDLKNSQTVDTFEIINNSKKEEASIMIDTSQISALNLPFSVVWKNGKSCEVHNELIKIMLMSCENISFQISFLLHKCGFFCVHIPIFILEEERSKIFNWLYIEGNNAKPFIESNIFEIYFHPVPLNIELQERINLKLHNFEENSKILSKITIPEKFSGIFANDVLTIVFPNGNTVSGNKSKEDMEILLVFKSSSPISFQTNIKFYIDQNEASLLITVYGTSDDCLLTTYAYPTLLSVDTLQLNQIGRVSTFSATTSNNLSDCALMNSSYWQTSSSYIQFNTYSVTDSISKIDKAFSMPKMEYLPIDEEDLGKEVEISVIDQSQTSVITPSFNYPFFPVHSKVEYDRYMQKIISAAERWLYTGVLNCHFYPSIINGITAVLSGICDIKKSSNDEGKQHIVDKSFLDILAEIEGSTVYSFFEEPKLLSENSAERISVVLRTYDNMLKFLIRQEAFLFHVHAIFLLNYTDYSSVTEKTKCMTREIFESRSKQCWLDVILQTYKCLVLPKIIGNVLTESPRDSVCKFVDVVCPSDSIALTQILPQIGMKHVIKKAKDKHLYKNEAILLAWLEYHYNQECNKDWFQSNQTSSNPMKEKKIISLKSLNDFQYDLTNSLAFIAVTAAYCPYVINEFFFNIYIYPKSMEELLHNAICIAKVWEKLRLGFIITPEEIINSNCVQMLMLTAHLFEFLPTYLPVNKISFNCPLNDTIIHQIKCNNPSDHSIGLVLQFFENDLDLFTIENADSLFHVHSHDNKTIKVKYHARKLNKAESYLLLCGSAVGPHFARNRCFILEGEPDSIKIIHSYKIKTKMYCPVDKNISIEVPFPFNDDYEIWISDQMPDKLCDLQIEKWSDIRTRKILRRLVINQEILSVRENISKVNLSITVACIAPDTRYFWLIFRSETGDFVIQITSTSESIINESIIVKCSRKKCICTSNKVVSACPLNISIKIPSRNIQLWDCANKMLQIALNHNREQEFWMKQIDTYTGLKIIYWLMDSYDDFTAKEFMHIFNTKVDYAVSISDKMNFLITPKTINIPDVRKLDRSAELKIHVAECMPKSYSTTLLLITHDKKEQRHYNITFLCDPT